MKIDTKDKSTLKKYLKKRLAEMKRTQGVIVTPYKLDESSRDAILSTYPSLKDMEIENRIDPSLLGGFVLTIGSEIIDASLAGRLDQLLSNLSD